MSRLVIVWLALSLPLCVLATPAGAAETLVRHGVTYTRRPWGLERAKPVLTEEEAKVGWVTFVPTEQDGIGPAAFPTRSEISGSMRVFACPGEYEAATFGVYAERALRDVTAQPGPLTGKRGAVLSPATVDVRAVRIWPQRTSWNSREYYLIPELLEKRYGLEVSAGGLQQFWITVAVPSDARPGTYEGYVRVSANGTQRHVPLTLRVLPLLLSAPRNKVWGVWSDSARWRDYSDEEVLEELRDWRAHGITTAVMYPLTHGRFSLVEGKLQADLSEFERLMDLYARAGLGGPVVASVQGLAGMVHNLLGQGPDDYGPQFAGLALEIVRRIEELRSANHWPEFVYHAVDEPGGHPAVQLEARQLLRILHDGGFPTFTTADVEFTNQVLDPFLDVRCYSVGYCAGSAEDAAARASECASAGDTYWWYGMGCYTGQEGRMAPNRHLAGFLFLKSQADGAWAWTFQRPQGDPYDDFDGAGSAEQKDACLTYPSPEGGPPVVPTLQWEGIREGVDDARYVELVRRAVGDVRLSNRPDAAVTAQRLETQAEAIIQRVPWLGEFFPSSAAQVARWELASLALDCADYLDKKPLGGGVSLPMASRGAEVALDLALGGASEPTLEAPLPVAWAPTLPVPPKLDGVVDEQWERAFHIADLVGQDGTPTPHRTEAYVARDRERLYLAFRCHEDRMQDLVARITERDGPVWTDDSVEAFVDTGSESGCYAHFILNAKGAQRDSLWRPASPSDGPAGHTEELGWDIPWQGVTGACPEGWCAEIAIPLARLPRGRSNLWRINLNRTRRAAGGAEYGCWSPTFGSFHVPQRFGMLLLAQPGLQPVRLQLGRPVWGDNKLLLTVDNTGGFVAVGVRVYVGAATIQHMTPTTYTLGPGKTLLELEYDLEREGPNNVVIELVPRAGEGPALEAERRRSNQDSGLHIAARVQRPLGRPVPSALTVLTVRRWLPPALELASRPVEVLQKWVGFDVVGSLHFGRRYARGTRLTASLPGTSAWATLQPLEGERLCLTVGTAKLPPGRYQVLLTLQRPGVAPQTLGVPFTVVPGPW